MASTENHDEQITALQSEVATINTLLANLLQSQLQQAALLQAFLARVETGDFAALVQGPKLAATGYVVDTSDEVCDVLAHDSEYHEQMQTFISARDAFFFLPLPKQGLSMGQFMKSEYVDMKNKEWPLTAFLALVGPKHKKVHAIVRDYHVHRTDKAIEHSIRGDEALWNFFSMKVCTRVWIAI